MKIKSLIKTIVSTIQVEKAREMLNDCYLEAMKEIAEVNKENVYCEAREVQLINKRREIFNKYVEATSNVSATYPAEVEILKDVWSANFEIVRHMTNKTARELKLASEQ